MAALRNFILMMAVFASAATAQTASRTFHLTTVPNDAALREVGVILHLLAVPIVSVDEAKQQITATGTDDGLALAAWLVSQLDTRDVPSAPPQYTVADSPDNSVEIFFLTNTPSQASLNEFVTTLRVVADLQQIFTYSPSHAIAVRGSADKTQLAKWLVKQMDVPAGSHPNTAQYKWPNGSCAEGVVEVAFLPTVVPERELYQIVTTVRSQADIRYIFTHSSAPQAIAFRGCLPQVQLADRLIQQAR
jgi:hypothetical protein